MTTKKIQLIKNNIDFMVSIGKIKTISQVDAIVSLIMY